jgi:SAM-dependent methyltransferase
VGCGFGIAAWQLKQLGYPVRGVEKSQHRADVANAHGVRTVKELSQIGTFDVVTAHHVLEHTVDPNAFIAEIAEHQDEGGILYLSVPNQVGEPSMGCLLFLPHLHSFIGQSLVSLCNRHGYDIHAASVSGFNLEVAFIKRPGKSLWGPPSGGATAKLSRAVHANGQGSLLSWCGNHTDAWFTTPERFEQWKQKQWKPRAVRAERVRGPGRFPVELEVPCLFVK